MLDCVREFSDTTLLVLLCQPPNFQPASLSSVMVKQMNPMYASVMQM